MMLPYNFGHPSAFLPETKAEADAAAFVQRLEAAKPEPEVPFEVHNQRPIDPDRCHAATKALCG